LGAYSALSRQISTGQVKMHTRHEMLDLVVVDGHAKGIITRNLATGETKAWTADAVLLCTGGYGNVYYLSTNAIGCNVTATYRAYRRGAGFANPCFTQIHPTCIPVSGDHQSKLTLMSESLRNDGRVWVPKKAEDCGKNPNDIAEADRDYYLERKYPSFGNLAPRDISSRSAKEACDEGRGVGPGGRGVYLDFADAISRLGEDVIRERYGNLFQMYERITGENAYQRPMRIYPAIHYTMGGLWVDYNLMTTIPGCFALGEANFSDHGANRLGASALMQGLSDGYFVIPYTIGNYLANSGAGSISPDSPEVKEVMESVRERVDQLTSANGNRSARSYHKQLGQIMWEYAGMARNASGLEKAIGEIQDLRDDFNKNLLVPGASDNLNAELERAGRVRDFIDFGELLCRDALERNESCGGHFREEYQTEDGEATRDDENFAHAAVWEYKGEGQTPARHQEELKYDNVKLAVRSYK
jgi:succinate dehydrogenase / fumarate reductase flavoprotein subunit